VDDVRNVELGDEDEEDKEQAQPRAVDASHRAERKFFGTVAVVLPCGAEADVAETDRAPGELSRLERESASVQVL
jgi:hypothetical protein